MTPEEAVEYVREHWDDAGACGSCGWHALLSEYDLPFDLEIYGDVIRLPCLSKDDEERWSHRGVRIWIEGANLAVPATDSPAPGPTTSGDDL